MSRFLHLMVVMVVLLALVSACTPVATPTTAPATEPTAAELPAAEPTAAPPAAETPTLRWSIEGINELASIDPPKASDSQGILAANMLFSGLVRAALARQSDG